MNMDEDFLLPELIIPPDILFSVYICCVYFHVAATSCWFVLTSLCVRVYVYMCAILCLYMHVQEYKLGYI